MIRHYQESDFDQLAFVWSLAFRAGNPYEITEDLVGQEAETFVIECDKKIVGGYRIHQMTASRLEQHIPCGGIAAVAVLPEARTEGAGEKLMKHALMELFKRKTPLSTLYAFKESYYRKFGWECIGNPLNITCQSHVLPKLQSSLPIQTITSKNYKNIKQAYEGFCKLYNGLNVRTERWWQKLFVDKENPAHIIVAGEPPQAYAIISFTQDFWVNQPINEFAWSSMEGYNAIIAMFKKIGINRTSVSWIEPSDSPFLARFKNSGVEVALNRTIMLRVVHVQEAFQSIKTHHQGSFKIKITDNELKQNEGPWLVEFANGAVKCSPDSSSEIEMDIKTFSQAFMGEPSFKSLYNMGLITSTNEDALIHAENFFPARACICLDDF